MSELYQFQQDVLNETADSNRVAYYLDMGLGKTYVGAEKLLRFGADTNLVICQKSKVGDWVDHFKNVCGCTEVYDLTKELDRFMVAVEKIGIINYDLVFRRPQLAQLKEFTLLLDESSLIQNDKAKRTKFIMKMHPKNVVLLSGTPVGGKYENLLTQMHLLEWDISETTFWNQYINWTWWQNPSGYWEMKVLGYKNEDRLRRKMRQHGCVFLKTDEVFDLPKQNDQWIAVDSTPEYTEFKKNSYLEMCDKELIGDCTLTQM